MRPDALQGFPSRPARPRLLALRSVRDDLHVLLDELAVALGEPLLEERERLGALLGRERPPVLRLRALGRPRLLREPHDHAPGGVLVTTALADEVQKALGRGEHLLVLALERLSRELALDRALDPLELAGEALPRALGRTVELDEEERRHVPLALGALGVDRDAASLGSERLEASAGAGAGE